MKKIIAMLLCLVVAGCTLASCGDKNNTSSTATQSSASSAEQSTASTGEETSAPSEDTLKLPDTQWDKTLTVYAIDSTDYYKTEIWNDEIQNEPVIDASYERSRWLEDTYGIKIDLHLVEGLGGTKTEIDKAIQGGIDMDLVADGLSSIAESSLSGYFYDLYEINSQKGNYLSLDKPWWDQSIQRDLSIGNKMFFLTGDIVVTDDQATWACLFNKKMIADYSLESPYEMVANNTWTIDNMYEMSKSVHLMNGSQMSYDPTVGDQWGIVVQAYDGLMFMLGCGQTLAKKDSDDIPYLRVKDETNINAFAKVFDLMLDSENVGVADFFGRWDSGVYGDETKIFANGNALFMPKSVTTITSDDVMLESDISYGILPMPKFDAEQDDYTSSATVYWLTVLAVPLSNQNNLECTLFAMEAMAWYGYQNLTPAFYDKVLKSQKIEDVESEEMLDLIFRNRTYDIATVYNWNDLIQIYSSVLGSKSNTLVSYYEGREAACQKALDTTLEQLGLK